MQVAAYCPMVFGVQDKEKRGVLVEVKNTMAMDSIPMSMVEDDAIGMELLVELAIDMPDIVEVGEVDVDMVILMPLIDIMLMSMIEVYRYALEESHRTVRLPVSSLCLVFLRQKVE